MRNIIDNSLLLAILIWFDYCFMERTPLLALFCVCLIWYLRVHDRTVVFVFVLVALLNIRYFYPPAFSGERGRVIKVTEKTAIIRSGMSRILLYTDEILPLDADIAFTGEKTDITSSDGFYRYDYAAYYRSLGIRKAVNTENVVVRKQHFSLRSLLQKKIEKEEDKALLYRFLLNVGDGGDLLQSSLRSSGLTVSGFLIFLRYLLNKLFYKEHTDRIIIVLTFFFCILYHFPHLLFTRLLFAMMGSRRIPRQRRNGIIYVLVLVLYPESWNSAGLLLPFVFRVLPSRERAGKMFLSCFLQSYFYYAVKPLQSLFFRPVTACSGILWGIAFMSLFVPQMPFSGIVALWDKILGILDIFVLPGSVLGLGLPVFVLVILMLKKDRYFWTKALASLFLFSVSGMFHPFAELSFINVGQGDAILIRTPLGKESVLVDTGKPSQETVLDNFLKAKGVSALDLFFVTHADNDHSGSRTFVAQRYTPEKLIEDHFDTISCGKISFLDMNDIVNDDENESSLVLYTEMNGMRILLMADADQKTEHRIVRNYNALQCDLLKLSHHGSATGNSDELLDQVQPVIGIVSSGAYSIYHHPSPEVTARLKQRGIPYLDTKNEGDITFVFTPFGNFFVCASGKIGII